MKKAIVSALVVVAAVIAAACGGSKAHVNVTPGEMPMDGNWDGVYASPAYGRMEFTANGTTVYGLYESERWKGKIEGEAMGDVLHFRWTQWNGDMHGKVRETKGNGWFRYIVENEGSEDKPRYTHFIRGEWGYGDDNTGNKWEAVKFPVGTGKILTTSDDQGEQKAANPFDRPAGSAAPDSSDSGSSGSGSGSGSGLGSGSSGGGNQGLEDDVDDLF